MEYGQLAGNKSINGLIYHSFQFIGEEDKRKFVKKFRELPPDENQVMHTFRELILGAYLGSKGLRVRHEIAMEGKTPDWCFLDKSGNVSGIIELENFHIDFLSEKEINTKLEDQEVS